MNWGSGVSQCPCESLCLCLGQRSEFCSKINAVMLGESNSHNKTEPLVAELGRIPTGSISFHCVSVCWPA